MTSTDEPLTVLTPECGWHCGAFKSDGLDYLIIRHCDCGNPCHVKPKEGRHRDSITD